MRSFRTHYLRHDSNINGTLTKLGSTAIVKRKCKICKQLVELNDIKQHRMEHQHNVKVIKWECTHCGKL